MHEYVIMNDELYHHGILGMKWGIRRFQPYPKDSRGKGKFIGKSLTSKQNGINMDLQRFAKRKKSAKQRKTYHLTKREADNIFTDCIKELRSDKKIFYHDMLNHKYTIENLGNYNFRCIGKKKIPKSTTGLLERAKDEFNKES